MRLLRVEFAFGLQSAHVDAQLLEQVEGQAGFDPAVFRVALEVDITPAHQHFVAVQVDPVIARQHAVG